MFRYLVIVGIAVSLGRATETDGLIQRIQNRYNGAHTLSVRFVEDFEFQGRQRPPESGTLTLRKQGKMRWDYSRPFGKLFISDGKTVYLYTPAGNRVEKMPVRDTEDMRAPLAFLLGHLELKKEFKDFKERSGADGNWLSASAKNDRAPYQSIDMLVGSNGEIERLKILGRDGTTMAFAFEAEQVNPPVPDSLFHFSIPAGAEVVDAVGFGAEGR